MRIYLWPYNSYSESASNFEEFYRIKRRNSRFVYRPNKLVINWGSQDCPFPCLNKNDAVHKAANKLRAFQHFKFSNVPCVPWTVNKAEAQEWARTGKVVVRHKISSSEGRGIEVVEKNGNVPDAPLYTRYIKKSQEYRVHVFRGAVIDRQRKVLRSSLAGSQGINWNVRNTANGFVFQRENLNVPPACEAAAVAAVSALGLDFGAVDVIWNEHHRAAFVLEVNTAPGVEGTTVTKYTQAFMQYYAENF